MDEFKTLPENLQSPLNSEDDAHNWLADKYKRSQALAPLREFEYFVKNFTRQDPSDYANFKKWSIADKKIALLGLNSAWMCGRNKDQTDRIND